jgi:hypothetical protein
MPLETMIATAPIDARAEAGMHLSTEPTLGASVNSCGGAVKAHAANEQKNRPRRMAPAGDGHGDGASEQERAGDDDEQLTRTHRLPR